MAHVEAIAREPHPLGAADHDRVRDYIRGEFAKLGLQTEVQAGIGRRPLRRREASVENILARLPGTASTRPLMLACHYDSVPMGPGAGDDAHAVAVLIETLRALRSGPRLRNDVIFLITDGEEWGLLGADLFMREHPWRDEPGVVLNFEARGTGGVPAMFETSEGNAWLIWNLRAAVPAASASSMAFEVYRRMPNGTDLSVFKAGGLAGMNFAFIDHPEFYHSPHDDPAHLDRSSVQEQGRYALALTRRFGGQDLRQPPTGGAVYFPTRWTPLIAYPASWAMPLAWIAVALLIAAGGVAKRRRARGLWIVVPLALMAALQFPLASVAPGVTYLVEWPLLAGIAAFALLTTAPDTVEPVVGLAALLGHDPGRVWVLVRATSLRPGPRLAALLALPAVPFLLLLAPAPELIAALGARRSAPALAVFGALILISVLPQVTLAIRRADQTRQRGASVI
jgi:hypothetical protein